MYEEAKKMQKQKHYASISELMRDALRRILQPDITENGFTREFEEEVLRSAAEPESKDEVWETPEDIDRFFANLKTEIKRKKHDKD